nr:cytochrome c [Acidobacteriota bacterium]
RQMRSIRVLAGLLVLVVIVGAGFVYSGAYDIAASSAEPGWRAHIFETVKDRAIDKRVPTVPPPPPLDDAQMIRTGLIHFSEMCVVCHGAPGVPMSEIGKGLNPDPPNLSMEGEEQSPSRLFWVLKNGIKMSGMPAFGPTHSDAQIWAIVAFLKRLPKLDEQQYAAMLREAGIGASPAGREPEHGPGPAAGQAQPGQPQPAQPPQAPPGPH